MLPAVIDIFCETKWDQITVQHHIMSVVGFRKVVGICIDFTVWCENSAIRKIEEQIQHET